MEFFMKGYPPPRKMNYFYRKGMENVKKIIKNLSLGKLSKLRSGETWETVQSSDVQNQLIWVI